MVTFRSLLVTGAAVGAAVAGGAALAGAATSSTATSTPSTSTTSGSQGHPGANIPAHGNPAHEGAEKPVTGTAATKAKAAAVQAAGGGSATEVTTDYTGNGYEVTVKKTDGSTVEIHLDNSFNVAAGPGRHHGGFNGPPHGALAHEGAEKPVTGTAAAKAKAAAVQAAGGGSATEVTTDYTGNGYEVTVKKTDGSTVEIHLDNSFNVATGPAGHHGGFNGHRYPGGARDSGSSTTTGTSTTDTGTSAFND